VLRKGHYLDKQWLRARCSRLMTRSLLGPCDSSARNGAAHSARRDAGRWPDDSQRVFRYSAVYLVVFVFTAGVNQYYGYDGYMPLDQSMIYNGARRLLSGQIPYVDFWTRTERYRSLCRRGSSGPSAFLGQTMFFRLL
jgi:hypothetical protein